MARAFIFVLDSLGIGGAEDAGLYGDAGADTLGHIAAECGAGRGDREGLRAGPLQLPNMDRFGLGAAAKASTGMRPAGLTHIGPVEGLWGYGVEASKGKDTPSGHWEIAGVPVMFDWGYFPVTQPCFPAELVSAFVARAGVAGILGDKHASGTAILEELGEEHIRTGRPILYTSADSVLQMAAHEDHFGLERLYQLCEIARELVDPLKIGRVIARPFVGEAAATFRRTANRRDYTTPPPEPTLLDRVVEAGGKVHAVGKIADIFAHRGISSLRKAPDNMRMFDRALEAINDAGDGDLVFANFVDFDSEFGHRRDVPGYAAALEAFDRRIPELEACLRAGDIAVLTADHGNDPTWRGSDHTREHIPVLVFGPGLGPGCVGRRETFADIGESIAAHLGLAPGRHGTSFLPVDREKGYLR
jgi:phosphopentomutase